ncbi:MAG: DNA translocase FtsK [Clostridiales bacterium]|nr:DNA translocase FtsK [Clostridiales bacterium]
MNHNFPINLLQLREEKNQFTELDFAKSMEDILTKNLEAFEVGASIISTRRTPFAIMFDVQPDVGVSVKKIKDLRLDLEIKLGSPVEIENIGETEFTIQVGIKNITRPLVGLRNILESDEFVNSEALLPVAAGADVMGKPFVFDLADTPHMLVAGTTGSGKSTFLNDLIISLLYTKTPDEIQFVMVDPKRVELGCYNKIPHLMMPVVTNPKQALFTLNAVKVEMERRYKVFSEVNARDLSSFNDKQLDKDKMPRMIVIVDEYADMIDASPKELEKVVESLTKMGRAAGIHLILSTQLPSSNVITPLIKANLPCRASFTVVDSRESKSIIDRTGAERLLGFGDMLYSATDSSKPIHAQAAYVSYEEVDAIIEYFKI